MVVGHGMMAKAFNFFENNDQVVIFASGVSNSLETRPEAFQREQSLIEKTLSDHPDKVFVYFSTCSIYDPSLTDSLYPKHKLAMEGLISSRARKYLILRLSQVVGNTKSPTIINYFYDKINNQEPFTVHAQSFRNLIDVEDIFKITCKIIDSENLNKIINIASSVSVNVVTIVQILESVLNKKAITQEINSGSKYDIQIEDCARIANLLNIKFESQYPIKTIQKYYATKNSQKDKF